MPALSNPRGWKILFCLTVLCAAWGSCYLFIELALRSFPPFLLTATRLGCAGLLLFAILWLFGFRALPTMKDVKFAFITAFFMSCMSAGLMTVGQQYIPSGTVAIFMGSVPLWMVLGGWLFLKEGSPTKKQAAGLLLGSASVALLGFRQGSVGMGSAFGMLCLVLNMAGWVGGSLFAKAHAHATRLSVLQSTALMLMAGGLELLSISLLMGESLDVQAVPMLGWASVLVLILFGGVTAYACYFWLLEHTSTAIAISYDYVNPVVGMILGYLVTGESIDTIKVGICFGIILALYFVIAGSKRL